MFTFGCCSAYALPQKYGLLRSEAVLSMWFVACQQHSQKWFCKGLLPAAYCKNQVGQCLCPLWRVPSTRGLDRDFTVTHLFMQSVLLSWLVIVSWTAYERWCGLNLLRNRKSEAKSTVVRHCCLEVLLHYLPVCALHYLCARQLIRHELLLIYLQLPL